MGAPGRVDQHPQPRAHRAFAQRLRRSPDPHDRPVGRGGVAAGGQNRPTVACAAGDVHRRSPAARRGCSSIATRSPGLGLHRSKGRKEVQPPDQGDVARMIALADELTPPSFAAYLLTACWSAARPGELDALRWTDLDLQAETIRIERQWNAQCARSRPPKHSSRRTIAMTEPVRERLLDAAARERLGLHDDPRDALHPAIAVLPLEPRPRRRRARATCRSTWPRGTCTAGTR